jgi:hypothetical protein
MQFAGGAQGGFGWTEFHGGAPVGGEDAKWLAGLVPDGLRLVQEVAIERADGDALSFQGGLESGVEGSAGSVVAAVPVEGCGIYGSRQFREGVGGGASQDRESSSMFCQRHLQCLEGAVQPPARGGAEGAFRGRFRKKIDADQRPFRGRGCV